MLTPEQLTEIQKRADTATPGPWHQVGPPWDRHLSFVVAGNADPHVGRFVCDLGPDPNDEPDKPGNEVADAEFIAHARTDVPVLLAEILRLKVALGEACEQVAQADDREAAATIRAHNAETRLARASEYVTGDLALTNAEMSDLRELAGDEYHEECGRVYQRYFTRVVRAVTGEAAGR